uniref:Trafficking regulator of GLUT4 (SLC2A4) 1b n=1 Tax=Hucho hucho TaxID=62062 RepID=A0A4W5K0B4_9TELE
MAINTDATFGKSALGEREVSHPTDFQDTEKLLSAVTTKPTGESNLKPCDTSLNMRSSIHSLNAEQNGHQSPLRSGSAPVSPSSFGPPLFLRSPVPPGSEPPSYLWLAVLSCFCLAVPVNMFALWYAHMVSFLALVCGMVTT